MPERLDITIGSTEALSYMHSHAEHHVHSDFKIANILLSNDLRPKVSDFGSSKMLVMGMYSRSVAADMSYVDLMYMKMGRFIDKSDVYRFDVVLLELITQKMAKYDGNRSLPMDMIASYKDDKGSIRRAMYDKDILAEGSGQSQLHLECLEMIGELPFRCLKDHIEDRPPMAEVVEVKKVKRRLDEAGN
jgi:serine/threonine protein kinase